MSIRVRATRNTVLTCNGQTIATNPGEVFDVTREEAARLIRKGAAVEVEEDATDPQPAPAAGRVAAPSTKPA